MYEQQLPGYHEAFKSYPWLVRDSVHYRFHVVSGSLAEREVENIERTQEKAFADIISFLGVAEPDRKISYYLYPDADTKEQLMGSGWFAQSVYNDFAVHALYTEQHRVIGPHEDTHLLSLPFGLSIGFLQEGMAERMVGHDWFGNSFKDTLQKALQKDQFVVSSDLLVSHDAWLATDDEYAREYYSLAALFAQYLLDTYGKDTYFKLYTALDRKAEKKENESRYQHIIGLDSAKLLSHFMRAMEAP